MIKKALALLLVVAFAAAATVVYAYMKPTAAASGPVQALPADRGAVAVAPSPVAATPVAAGSIQAAPNAPLIFEISQQGTQARFVIDEVLRGSPKTVVGTTDQVAGQIVVRPAERSVQVGTVQVNARTLTTDDEQRNRAVRNRILMSDQYEFISFTPTAMKNLPTSASVGETYSFQMVGDLKIRDVVKEVVFDVSVTPTSETRIEGKAATTVKYADWGIAVPQVPFVAGVSDDVRLELDFVALAK
jgi:polyisoprenoid-binding protein YceI